MTLNKRTLLEEADSSEPMTDTPPNSSGETVSEKLKKDFKFSGILQNAATKIDELEANRRAILSVTKRRFTDDEVTEESWRQNYDEIVDEINRKVYESQSTGGVIPRAAPKIRSQYSKSNAAPSAPPINSQKKKMSLTVVEDIDFDAVPQKQHVDKRVSDDDDDIDLSDEEEKVSHDTTNRPMMISGNSPIKLTNKKFRRKKTTKTSKKKQTAVLKITKGDSIDDTEAV